MTIEERARQIAEKWKSDIIHGGEDLSFTHLEYVAKQAATEQDRIARAEERERCIKIAQDTHCMFCSLFNKKSKECGLIDYPCTERDVIRKAIEEGGNHGKES